MTLIARGGSLIVGSDGKLTTNEDCCCEPECNEENNFGLCPTPFYSRVSVTISGGTLPCTGLDGTYIFDIDCDIERQTIRVDCPVNPSENYLELFFYPGPTLRGSVGSVVYREPLFPFTFPSVQTAPFLLGCNNTTVEIDGGGGTPSFYSLFAELLP